MSEAFEQLKREVIAFRDQREWKQFHSPKNLAEGLTIEAAELLENFLWLKDDQSHDLPPAKMQNVREELADVFLFVIYLCDALGIDLYEETRRKMQLNARKYPVEKSRGRSDKYTDL